LSFADPAAVRDIYTSDKFIKDEKFYVSLGSNDQGLEDTNTFWSELSGYSTKIFF
jgi:hypothetical protein